MNSIKCPKCGTVFQVDEAEYASIANQVKNQEFQNEVDRRLGELTKQLQTKQENQAIKDEQKHRDEMATKDGEIQSKDLEIAKLKNKIDAFEQNKQLELQAELLKKDQELQRLKNEIDKNEKDKQMLILEEQRKNQDEITKRDEDIIKLKNAVESEKSTAQMNLQSVKEDYEAKMKQKDDAVAYYKDLKARMSTKMVGESLEEHCSTEFNRVRPLFPNAYFEKDNDASGGTKGDFIFRDYYQDNDGKSQEYVSIMFEMKNEMEETATKHKNEDFFKKLDDDRKAKKCEYAVLVSLLEPDSELYNTGIVDVSYRYPKMYVVRPQCFLPFITLIVQASNKSIEYQKELIVARSQSIDITNFEGKLNDFKDKFGYNFSLANKKFDEAIKDIDKSINLLQDIRANLVGSENNLRLANEKAEKLTIKQLVKGNPTMTAMFEEVKTSSQESQRNDQEEPKD